MSLGDRSECKKLRVLHLDAPIGFVQPQIGFTSQITKAFRKSTYGNETHRGAVDQTLGVPNTVYGIRWRESIEDSHQQVPVDEQTSPDYRLIITRSFLTISISPDGSYFISL
ncbi:hypothetical protein QAD02_024365 [Eretmocerus hayati]|uniref:Uncharacterized protein n=1 Tax=Eretmocerus hayati TaxID=131215 RepID=A0ACC2PY87_9HYME|nr:hypothetical protein QAD02_024365 [Eretmocerus hayati]